MCVCCCAVQLEERRLGNTAYQKQQFSTALHHYQRALAVVDFVVGQSLHDQAEVNHNKATVLLNMAAVHMALKVSCKQVWRVPLAASPARTETRWVFCGPRQPV